MSTLLSLDLSSKSSGWAVFKDGMLVDSGCITASSNNLITRLNKMNENIKKILESYKIEKIVLEEVRPENGLQNIKTHRALMWAQAGVAFTAYEVDKNIVLDYIYPNEWRSYLGIHTGRGVRRETLKKKDIEYVKNTFHMVVNDDEADAIGIGQAYLIKNEKPKGAF